MKRIILTLCCLSFSVLQCREPPAVNVNYLYEFVYKDHWYLQYSGFHSYPFIHHPDCPCINKKLEENKEKK